MFYESYPIGCPERRWRPPSRPGANPARAHGSDEGLHAGQICPILLLAVEQLPCGRRLAGNHLSTGRAYPMGRLIAAFILAPLVTFPVTFLCFSSLFFLQSSNHSVSVWSDLRLLACGASRLAPGSHPDYNARDHDGEPQETAPAGTCRAQPRRLRQGRQRTPPTPRHGAISLNPATQGFAEAPKRFAEAPTGFGASHKASARRRKASSCRRRVSENAERLRRDGEGSRRTPKGFGETTKGLGERRKASARRRRVSKSAERLRRDDEGSRRTPKGFGETPKGLGRRRNLSARHRVA